MLLFKYMAPSGAQSAFRNAGQFTLRFNLPESYNDPYELFLRPDSPLESDDERSYYEIFLKKLPQAPVTCFSKRPESVVMWAHYGNLSSGVCLAIDEDSLFTEIDGGFVHDVEYSDEPALISTGAIRFACTTTKNRHTLNLLALANREAYFRKRSGWSYEHERRLVVTRDDIEDVSGMMLRTFSSKCLERVIIGPNVPDDLLKTVTDWAQGSGVETLRMHYSRRLAEPFFRSSSATLRWAESEFKVDEYVCGQCFEPIEVQDDSCEWCKITEEQLSQSLRTNQTVLFISAGLMDGLPLRFAGIEPRGRKFPGGSATSSSK